LSSNTSPNRASLPASDESNASDINIFITVSPPKISLEKFRS
jgi:hypothetical protein